MAAIPYASKMSFMKEATLSPKVASFQTGSYVYEAGIGINPVEESWSVTWYLTAAERTALFAGFRSNPVTPYDFTDEGVVKKVIIADLKAQQMRPQGDFFRVTGTLKRRHL